MPWKQIVARDGSSAPDLQSVRRGGADRCRNDKVSRTRQPPDQSILALPAADFQFMTGKADILIAFSVGGGKLQFAGAPVAGAIL